MAGAIAQDRQSCQSVFWLMKDALSYRSARAGEGSECARTGSLWSRSLGVRASGCVGLRWQAVFGFQIVWNRSTRRAAERRGARVGRPRWVSILTMTGGSSIAVPLIIAPHFTQHGRRVVNVSEEKGQTMGAIRKNIEAIGAIDSNLPVEKAKPVEPAAKEEA